MKKLTSIFNFYTKSFTAFLFIVILFSACKKEDTDYNNNTPVSGLMAFNLAPDKAAVGFALTGNNLTNNPLGYTAYTGVYLPIYTGTRQVKSFDFFTGSTIAVNNSDFADSMYYSAFLLGANGKYQNLVVQDKLDMLTPVSGKAWARYVNAIPDSTTAPVVNIDEGAINETAAYATVSSFKQVNAGSVTINVNNGGTINTSRTITLEENKIYTILLTGLPNATDSSQTIQIKFIQNGTANL